MLIYTGGTIGMGLNPRTGALEPLRFDQLSKQMPELGQLQTSIQVYQFPSPIDSSDMSPRFWEQLVAVITQNYQLFDGFVILHGTDTMAYTASALSFMFEDLDKPIILTGSQLPIGQLRTDGKENLITSIEIASAKHDDGTSMVPEVCIYFSGKLLRGNRATKINADGFDAFESFNYPHLADVGVNIVYNEKFIHRPDFRKVMKSYYKLDPNVMVFTLFPGIQDYIVRHLLEAPELHSIVMRSYGSGNAPQRPWLINLLHGATCRGVNIVNISQCAEGTVAMERYDTGYQLQNAGVISGYDCTVESAVTKLMFLQALYDNSQQVREKMNQNLRGEITI